jgi:hypothetical protein
MLTCKNTRPHSAANSQVRARKEFAKAFGKGTTFVESCHLWPPFFASLQVPCSRIEDQPGHQANLNFLKLGCSNFKHYKRSKYSSKPLNHPENYLA